MADNTYKLVASDGNIYCIGSREMCERTMNSQKTCKGAKGNSMAKCTEFNYSIEPYAGEYPITATIRLPYRPG